MASALAVDPNTGDVLVCGSTTGGLFQRQNSAPSNTSGDDVARQPAAAAGGVAEAYCAKLAAADGKVSFFFMYISRYYHTVQGFTPDVHIHTVAVLNSAGFGCVRYSVWWDALVVKPLGPCACTLIIVSEDVDVWTPRGERCQITRTCERDVINT